MGEHRVHTIRDERQIRVFTRTVLEDIRALEAMIERGMIEHGVRRAGVEQEMLLVDTDCHPAPVSVEVLARLSDPRFTSELVLFNVEANLAPHPLGGHFLAHLEDELNETLEKVSNAAEALGARVLLTGTLPTLRQQDLDFDNLTPEPRFQQINEAISEARGGSITVVIDDIEHY